MLDNPFKGFLYFAKSDRRAFYTICCIVVFCAGVVCVVDSIDRASMSYVTEDTHGTMGAGRGEMAYDRLNPDASFGRVALHAFDPNDVDSLTLLSFGIKAYKVRNFLRYRAAGKVFLSAEDMGSTYGWTRDDVERLTSYVNVDEALVDSIRNARGRYVNDNGGKHSLPAHGMYHSSRSVSGGNAWRGVSGVGQDGMANYKGGGAGRKGGSYDREAGGVGENGRGEGRDGGYMPKFESLTLVDVNAADSATLRRIPGVGEKTCMAITRYRERLGGFYDVEQLLDIKLVSRDLLKWFEVRDGFAVKKLKINSASFNELNSHPYISYEQAKDLLAYIRLYGIVADGRVLCSTGIFSEEEMRKLKPYIDYGK